jgi:outer membrane lipoprotein LolB
MRPGLVASVAALALAGCVAAPVARPPGPVAPESRRAALQALDAWSMAGRVAVASGERGASASLDWRQAGGGSDIELRGPFGTGALRVSLSDGELSLSDGESRLEGEDARRYLEGELGLELPVRELRYWVLGVPAPGSEWEETAGPGDLPQRIVQRGWTVTYERYRRVAGADLPGRMTAESGSARVRLAVSRWELPP